MKNKKVVISFFIASLFLSVLIQTAKLVNYALNQEEYTAEFCENKGVPDSHCKGSCHLSKELKLASNDITSQTGDFVSVVVSIFSFQQIEEIKPSILPIEDKGNLYVLENHIQELHITSIFRPPIA